ncbi:MAG: GerMN domain-containing protein [Bacillota bacterium]|nr:GerMN domain-containing protein [Bacillota bacterium]
MKKFKKSLPGKILTLMLVSVFTLSMITGCAQNSDTSEQVSTTGVTAIQSSSTEALVPQDNVETSPVTDNIKTVSVSLYFPSSDNSTVLKEKRQLEVKSGAIVRATINALLAGPKDTAMRKAIPDGTKLLGAKVVDKVATLDFSKEFATANDTAEIVERISVIDSIASIQGVEKVKILVEGKDWMDPSGKPYEESSFISPDNTGNKANADTGADTGN